MANKKTDDGLFRGEVLVHLRHGIRRSTRLAEELASDAIVGNEALALLGRLNAITAELDRLSFTSPDPRRPHNDPFWNKPPHAFRYSQSTPSGM